MNNIKRIIKDDLLSVSRNLFALIVAIGVCILPALYAWFNIYSNWDPYGNTANLDLAAVSLDKGYMDEEGVYRNVGDEVIADARVSDSVRWHILTSPEEAREGVEAGEYYAAIVINEDFTYNMYNVFTEDVSKPQLVFYENQKKNPVATKISDTVVGKIQDKINQKFVKVMTTEVFKDVNELGDDIEEEGGIDALVQKMERINSMIEGYRQTIDGIIQGNAVLNAAIYSASEDSKVMMDKSYQSADALARTRDSLSATQDTLNDFSNQTNLCVWTIQSSLDNISNRLNQATLLNDMKSINSVVKESRSDISLIKTDLNALQEALQKAVTGDSLTPEQQLEALEAIATVKTLSDSTDKIDNLMGKLESTSIGDGIIKRTEKEEASIRSKVDECRSEINDAQGRINSQLIPELRNTIDNLEIVLSDASTLMRQMGSTLSGMGNVFSSLQTAVNAGNISLSKTADAIIEVNKRLDKIIDKVNKAANNEKVQVLLDTLKGDPELYGEFFSKLESVNVYPVDFYGSAVAPFYTILAIWVGAIILAAIVKPVPAKEKYFYMKETEIFFGRYGMFFIMGQIQTLIIVLGDLTFLGVQCLHPILFYIASAFTSMVFSLLIYALVVAFADVGKAIAVVILVLQIAGSSGTYPIELLPEFFKNVYLFFPFPYAINALRECVAGMYEADYVIYLLELSIFLILALVIGIWIRRPFDPLKHFMERRMEDTEVM